MRRLASFKDTEIFEKGYKKAAVAQEDFMNEDGPGCKMLLGWR
jgi:hypothetical protein